MKGESKNLKGLLNNFVPAANVFALSRQVHAHRSAIEPSAWSVGS
jgi:hypothetical protein